MLKTLCFLECLFRKSEFKQLALSACYAKVFVKYRYEILPQFFLTELQYCTQCINS